MSEEMVLACAKYYGKAVGWRWSSVTPAPGVTTPRVFNKLSSTGELMMFLPASEAPIPGRFCNPHKHLKEVLK